MKPKICIVMSTYNSGITNKLLLSAKNELKKYGVYKVKDYKVPGAFEIPVAISRLAKKFDGFIAIGCIIRGQTANFDLISSAITNAIMNLSITTKNQLEIRLLHYLIKTKPLKDIIKAKRLLMQL